MHTVWKVLDAALAAAHETLVARGAGYWKWLDRLMAYVYRKEFHSRKRK